MAILWVIMELIKLNRGQQLNNHDVQLMMMDNSLEIFDNWLDNNGEQWLMMENMQKLMDCPLPCLITKG